MCHPRTPAQGYSRAVPLPERALIAEIRRQARHLPDRGHSAGGLHIVRGIGDDCAVLRSVPGREILVTTDFTLEGVHFRRKWHSPDSVGHRCLARGLSDIAAMGGKPEAIFLSLALPPELPQSWVRNFIAGLHRLARKHGATLAGGDTAQSPNGILADIIVLGSVPAGKAILRSGAKAGDRIFVTGELGGSAAAVRAMYKRPNTRPDKKAFRRHFYPEPRVEVGSVLREKKFASAMIDTSDGLSTDVLHICQESGVGAEIYADRIPRARVGSPRSEVSLDLALHGGEDYELLFTVPARKKLPSILGGIKLSEIGRITARKDVVLISKGVATPLEPRGWEHFRRK